MDNDDRLYGYASHLNWMRILAVREGLSPDEESFDDDFLTLLVCGRVAVPPAPRHRSVLC